MTGKERVIGTIEGHKTDKVPWVPFTGVHAGKLLGYHARTVSTDVDSVVEAACEVNRLYHPDGQPVMFDLQIEAELLGCEMLWSDDGPPSVSSHPLAEITTIPTRIPGPTEGRLGVELEATRRLKKAIGATSALYGVCCGPFTLASHLRGTEIFMDLVGIGGESSSPVAVLSGCRVGDALEHLREVALVLESDQARDLHQG